MRAFVRLAVLLSAVIALSPSYSSARTWTVEKDGSGDFTVIQDALDAAAPGDTVLIGPGRFDEMQVRDLLVNGGSAASIMWVQTAGLTIIGSGPETTIVGPASYVGEFQNEGTANLIIDSGASCDMSGIWFENARFEVNVFASSVVEDCKITRGSFRHDHSLFVGSCSGVEVRRVEFVDTGGVTTLADASDLLIEDCTFEDASDWTYAIQMSNGTPNVTVRRCTIAGGGGGIQYSGSGTVEDCVIQGTRGTGLEAVGGGHMIARRCYVGVTRTPIASTIGRLELYDSVLEGGTRETILSSAEIYVRNSHILNAGGWTVYGRTSVPNEYIDVRHNWWGTSDPTQIEAWISDLYGTVLWQPYNDMPIPTEAESISRLKGKFGGG